MAQAPVTIPRDETHKGFVDFDKNEARNMRLQNLGADIGTPVDGLIFYRTDTDKVRVYINGSWEDLATMDDVTAGGISSTIVDAKGDLIVGTGADTVARLAIGANGTLPVAASGETTGILWRTLTEADLTLSATDRLVGRDTAAGGAAEEIAVGGGIEFTGSQALQLSAFTGDVTKAAGSTVTALGSGVIVDADVNASAAIAATKLAFTPAQGIAATTVQAAIEEAVTDLTALINTGIQGQKFKDPVDAHLTTAAPNTPTYNSGAGTLTAGANAAFPTVDGVAAVANQDYLLTGQASTFQNGIYTLTTLGSGAAPWVLTRRTDADTATELQDAAVMVEAGTLHVGTIWTQVNAIADLTAAAQSWIETNRNEVYTSDGTTIELSANSFRIATGAAGNGLTGGGGSALAVGAGTGLTVNANDVAISAGGVGVTELAAAVAGNGLTGGGGSALAVGAGTGIISNANDVAVDRASATARVMLVSSGALTGGANSEVLTHNLGTRDIAKVTILNNASPFDAWGEPYFEATSTSTVTIYAGAGVNLPASYRWVVAG